MKVYYFTISKNKRNTAGVKAPSDITEICKKAAYNEFVMPMFPTGKGKVYIKTWLLLVGTHYWKRFERTIDDNSVVIFQHPMYGNRLTVRMIPHIQRKKHAKFIALIHDLESLRGGIAGVSDNNKKTNDIADNLLLKKFDAVICHNEQMKKYLIQQGFVPERIINLGIFDYLTSVEKEQSGKSEHPSVAIAGNLAIGKCAYIYNIFGEGHNTELTVNLYGVNFQKDRASNQMVYHGSFDPEELPGKLRGDFGLVWDGYSAKTCAGNTGEYLRYNNPHKTSLYLVSGMPVIVWKKAAIADFVTKNGVGLAVDSLYDLENAIKDVSIEEYNQMCRNAGIIAQRLKEGYYTKIALKKAFESLKF